MYSCSGKTKKGNFNFFLFKKKFYARNVTNIKQNFIFCLNSLSVFVLTDHSGCRFALGITADTALLKDFVSTAPLVLFFEAIEDFVDGPVLGLCWLWRLVGSLV